MDNNTGWRYVTTPRPVYLEGAATKITQEVKPYLTSPLTVNGDSNFPVPCRTFTISQGTNLISLILKQTKKTGSM